MALVYIPAILLAPVAAVFGDGGISDAYSPLKISDVVAQGAGVVAWGPDSKRIAYIRGGVHIYDRVTKDSKTLSINSPYSLAWSGGRDLAVLYIEEGKKGLCIVDSVDLSIRKVPLDISPDAVFWIREGAGFLLFSERIDARRLWADYHFDLSVLDISSGTIKKLYGSSINLPVKNARQEDLKGMIRVEINPLDFTALVLEFVMPPRMPSYTKLVSVDYITGRIEDLGRINQRQSTLKGSLSPDGRRLAFADDSGGLQIYNFKDGSITGAGDNIRGGRPSWNPAGSQIYFGGYIVTPGAKGKEGPVPDAAATHAFWSPDGRAIAVITEGGLWILENFRPSFVLPDRPLDMEIKRKLLMLKELLSEKLITESDYIERSGRLFKEADRRQ